MVNKKRVRVSLFVLYVFMYTFFFMYISVIPFLQVDNRWVIATNGPLLVSFDGHVNIEECRHMSGGVKYVVKYLSKGVFL